MDLKKRIEKILKDSDDMILACKAKGGYRFREQFRCTDLELEKKLKQCEIKIRATAVSLVVAEEMLREPPPSIHSRWDDYIRRRNEALKIKKI